MTSTETQIAGGVWQAAYIVAALSIVLSIKWLSSPVTARRGVVVEGSGQSNTSSKPLRLPRTHVRYNVRRSNSLPIGSSAVKCKASARR